MTLPNKVAQFDADSDTVNQWLNGPASGPGSTLATAGGTLRTPNKLIADKDADINLAANGVLAQTVAVKQAADASALSASNSAGTSTTQAGIATTQAGLAATAKTAAEAARDASQTYAAAGATAAKYYDTIALGRAAVADTFTFGVKAGGTDGLTRATLYRRDTATTQTLIVDQVNGTDLLGVTEKQKLKADLQLGKNLYNPADIDVVTGFYVDQGNGALIASAGSNASGFIPVQEGTTYTRSNNSSGVVTQFAWYNATRQYISGGTAAAALAPAGAKFLRTTMATSSTLFMVEASSAVTRYVPYTPTLPPAQIRDGGLTELKHSFSSIGYQHTKFVQPIDNLFNVLDADVVLGSFVDGATGELTVSASYNTTGFIPVTGGATYRLSYGNQIAWYDASKKYVSGVTGIGGGATTQVAPASACYLRVMVLTSVWSVFKVQTGSTSTPWTAFQLKLAGPGGVGIQATPSDASVTPAKVTFLPVGKNKFNIAASDVTLGSYIIFSNGLPDTNGSFNATGFIPVVAETTYRLSYKHQIAWYNSSKVYISGSNSTDTNATQTAPVGAAFLRCSVLLANWATFQVEVGTLSTGFESFGYVLQDSTYPVRLVNTETDYLTIAAKQYVPYGKEIAVYHENITRDYPTYRGKTGIVFTGGKEAGPSTKIIPTIGQSGTTIAATVTAADASFAALVNKAFSIIVSDAAKTTTANIQNIGDSYTGRMTWANVINGTAAATGLTFSGNRTSGAASPAVRCEGQGGWLMNSYFTVDYLGFLSPFMQPVTAGYLYYGQTAFWIDANSVTPSYNAGSFTTTKDAFSASTGRKLAPNVGDVMGDAGGYIQWNGSAWVAIVSGTFGGFAFSYAKYRTAWAIAAPTILHVLLGTNDFAGASETTFLAAYPGYKANYDALIASVKADTPAVKIIVGIPVSSGRQGRHGTLATEKAKRAYYLLAKNLNADFGGREAESIYLLDYHSAVDRYYGYDNAYEKPFTDYSGATGDDLYKSDTVHLSADGFKQMGNAYMGLIQFLR